uniref:Uncharacterized protein n=1 Tax=Arundo donax TaxID=35708 RepID=A0A0A9C8G9_ARUDO
MQKQSSSKPATLHLLPLFSLTKQSKAALDLQAVAAIPEPPWSTPSSPQATRPEPGERRGGGEKEVREARRSVAGRCSMVGIHGGAVLLGTREGAAVRRGRGGDGRGGGDRRAMWRQRRSLLPQQAPRRPQQHLRVPHPSRGGAIG